MCTFIWHRRCRYNLFGLVPATTCGLGPPHYLYVFVCVYKTKTKLSGQRYYNGNLWKPVLLLLCVPHDLETLKKNIYIYTTTLAFKIFYCHRKDHPEKSEMTKKKKKKSRNKSLLRPMHISKFEQCVYTFFFFFIIINGPNKSPSYTHIVGINIRYTEKILLNIFKRFHA